MRGARGAALGALAALALAAGPPVGGPAGAGPAAGPGVVERRLGLMGTTLALTVEAADRARGLAARLSTWRDDTELARLNRAPVGAPFPLSPALAADLRDAVECARATGGAFDPTVGPLVAAWDLRHGGRVPAAAELARAVAATGFPGLALAGPAAIRRRAGLTIEEGGWGKGAALRDALAALDRAGPAAGAASALLDLGGQVAVWSAGRARRAGWTVDVADPRRRHRPVIAIAIDHGSVSTSGNSERAVEVGGRRYGHILDPRTGRPVPDFGSVSVWAADPLVADCLSTGLYVMGPERALAWAADHSGAGSRFGTIEVLVLAPEGGRSDRSRRIIARASPGLWPRLTVLAEDVSLDPS